MVEIEWIEVMSAASGSVEGNGIYRSWIGPMHPEP
jgi:hypothetical protein